MFSLIHHYSTNRLAWLLLFLVVLGFEGTALYFQHGLHLAPCTFCIYIRCALFGILAAAILGLIYPKLWILRLIAILFWLYCAYVGFQLAWQLARMQFPLISNSFEVCPAQPNFPSWLPLHDWIPSVFRAQGPCSVTQWQFLTLEMSQWMIISFGAFFIVGLIVLIAQIFPTRSTR